MKRFDLSCGTEWRSQRTLSGIIYCLWLCISVVCVQVCWPSLTSSTFSIVITSLLWWAASLCILNMFLSGPPPSDWFLTSAGADLRAGRTQDWDMEGCVQHKHLHAGLKTPAVHSVLVLVVCLTDWCACLLAEIYLEYCNNRLISITPDCRWNQPIQYIFTLHHSLGRYYSSSSKKTFGHLRLLSTL